MGGHGGLNILPQKRWNVYNFDNREKVRKDEEAAAKEEQLKREQSRRRDTEFRLQKLREARGLEPLSSSSTTQAASESLPESKSNNHMNLFEGIKIFDPVGIEGDEKMKGSKRMRKEVAAAAPKVILPEDEKYRLGYGVAGKGVKLPWYMAKRNEDDSKAKDAGDDDQSDMVCKRSRGKKSLEELRNERMKREKKEKERERALLLENGRHVGSASNNRGSARR